MKRFTLFYLAATLALLIGLTSDRAMAQFTDEFIFCTDGSTPDSCRATAIAPNPDGTVTWDRAELGSTVCWGAGYVARPTDCGFFDYSYAGLRSCPGIGFSFSVAWSFPGWDLAIDCATLPPEFVPPMDLSLRYIGSNCFFSGDISACGFLKDDNKTSGGRTGDAGGWLFRHTIWWP